jgi:hypothetical protein
MLVWSAFDGDDGPARLVIRAVVWVLMVVLAAAPVAAGSSQVFDLDTRAPVTPNKTWVDLLRQIFPDLQQETGKDGKVGYVVGGQTNLRPLHGEAFIDGCPDLSPRIERIDYADVEISGQMRVIVGVTTEGGACFGALALFDGKGDAKLLDVANIQQDMNYDFGDDFARRLGADGRLVVADSSHTNTSHSPDNNVLVLVTADKLSFIGNVSTDSAWDCEHHRSIAEDPYVVVTPDYGPFDRITGYVKRTVRPVADDCRTPQGKPAVTITRIDWRWDAAKKAYRKVSP